MDKSFPAAAIQSSRNQDVQINALPLNSDGSFSAHDGLTIAGDEKLVLPRLFHPPVEFNIVAQTDSTNLRLGYAADQVIFNWEVDPTQLRIDGGPAAGQQKDGAGSIPASRDVNIRWVVKPDQQQIYVDGQLRFEHKGDYSKLRRPLSIFTYQAIVTVKSITITGGK